MAKNYNLEKRKYIISTTGMENCWCSTSRLMTLLSYPVKWKR